MSVVNHTYPLGHPREPKAQIRIGAPPGSGTVGFCSLSASARCQKLTGSRAALGPRTPAQEARMSPRPEASGAASHRGLTGPMNTPSGQIKRPVAPSLTTRIHCPLSLEPRLGAAGPPRDPPAEEEPHPKPAWASQQIMTQGRWAPRPPSHEATQAPRCPSRRHFPSCLTLPTS